MRGWGLGECQDFPSKFSCLTVPKNFVGQPFRVSLFCYLSKFLTAPKNAVGVSFCAVFPKILWPKKLEGGGGVIKIFRRTFLSHSAEKCRRGTL